jgi:peptide-methionine (S)-S-oxide reductase
LGPPGALNLEVLEADIDKPTLALIAGNIVHKFRKANPMYLAAVLGAASLLITACTGLLAGATPGANIPAPAVDEPAGTPGLHETALLAGGCFWGVQGVFEHVRGVSRAVSGYAGGAEPTAHYDVVSTGTTGHAESVQITYDPSQITYGQLLRIYFSVVQDPTQLNKQGPDVGTQYRSAIFPQNETQKQIAKAYITQLDDAKVFNAPIVTRIENATEFFPAEAHHQDFLNSNPTNPYIAINDMPKLDNLKRQYPDLYREQPVLALADGA